MTNIPNLAGIAPSDMVEQIGTGKYAASYINWSRTMALLREHAPGWQPELVHAPDGYIPHQAPGGYLMIRFRNGDTVTPAVPRPSWTTAMRRFRWRRSLPVTLQTRTAVACAWPLHSPSGWPTSCGQTAAESGYADSEPHQKAPMLHPSCGQSQALQPWMY